ncbi:site-specific DNA-methyltransferase [Pallidibacillus pasinlerensis]|uniref:Site-specific DNA-methyltransferase n=1 Tax=Pallidibacillus pasinlerensis TaxID=2703818 RepID=A0ABX0A3K3_9BACI|nr:site-specific DNA-methyltransferase [Pallidibacillus pasinlerensis]NCU18013.1 site-specific DNA-methyltransferase [Pallidibacillus pasinlerensis]
MQKLDGKTFNVVQDNIEKLKQLFPEVFTENKIDFEKLMLTLGEHVEKEKERYEFTWNGKTKAIQLAQKQTTGTLRPCKEESVNWDKTKNLYIEGDNLEVLRVLQNSYRNKVKMIYIDPPYNTGKDFVYKDDFQDNIKNYKEKNQENMKSNPETNGRFHTDWLNMMYPRLKIAKNLLSDDGVIFISIDDMEIEKLKMVCNEIFGEENFIANIIWERSFSPVNLKKHFSENHDFILCYAKNINVTNCNGLKQTEELLSRYKNPDNDPRGPWQSDNFSVGPAVPEKIYEITTPSGRKILPPDGRCWLLTKDRYEEFLKDNRIWFGENGNNVPRIKRFLSEVKNTLTPMTIWKYSEVGHSQEAKQNLKKLFDGASYFDYPKSINLIKRMLELYSNQDSIIMDFFSGSATTAHAVMEINAEDSGNRRFIMVQLPEPTDEKSDAYKAGYKNICEIGKERIRRAGQKILEENKDKEGIEKLDIGFKVFKLDDTNLKVWDEESADLERDLLDLIDPVKEGRTQEDVVYEILLKYGVDLTVPIEETKVADKVVYSVGMGYLLICLERDLTLEHIEEIAKKNPARVVFYDEGFKDDTVRINAQQILKRYGVEDIRVI